MNLAPAALGRAILVFMLTVPGLWACPVLSAPMGLQLAARGALPAEKSDMTLIPAGEFVFGSSKEDVAWTVKTFFAETPEWYLNETPAQKIYMDAFYIDRLEVTNARYRVYTKKTGRPPPRYSDDPKYNRPDLPVVGVNWQEANDYCQWAGKHLPNEAEWEKAARGTDQRRYPWGNGPIDTRANVRGRKDGFRYTAPVGSFPEGKSPYGVLDLAGNVWEWMDNWYLPYPGNGHKEDLFGKTLKVIRGGAWNANWDLARSTSRGKSLPGRRHNSIGFRCAAGKNN